MKKIRVLIYIFAFSIASYSLALSQSDEDYIYNRESFLEPGTVEDEISQEPPKIINYPFALGPKFGVILGGSYINGFSPYLGVIFEFPFNRFVGMQANLIYHQYNITVENYRWVRGNVGSAVIPLTTTALGGASVLNYLEAQLYFKVYIKKFWIGVGVGINLFLGGTIQRWYTFTPGGTSLDGIISDNIGIFAEEVEAETVFYLAFNIGYVTELANDVFLFPELYTHIYAFDRFFLNKEWFVIGGNLALGYKF